MRNENWINQPKSKFKRCCYTSTEKERCLVDYPIDFAAYGESELTFIDLISHIKGQKEMNQISGLMYKDEKGQIHINKPLALIAHVDEISFPAYDLFEMNILLKKSGIVRLKLLIHYVFKKTALQKKEPSRTPLFYQAMA